MKIITGKVIFKKDERTAKVAVDRVVIHPIYKKRYTKTKNYAVHDTVGSKVDDTVKFAASKPYSKTKRWKIIEIVEDIKQGEKKKKETKKGGSKTKSKAKKK